MLLIILESAARAAILIALVWAGLKLLRVRNPHIELAIWSAVLIAALAMPALMEASPFTVTAPPALAEHLDLVPDEIPVVLHTAATVASQDEVAIAPDMSAASLPRVPWSMIAIAAYAVVAGALGLRLLLACALVWRLRRNARVATAQEAPDLAVRITDALASPVTVGMTILLPAAFSAWPQEKRAAVLFHEGVHAARGDFYVNLLAGLHCTLFWFNPLAWWLRKHLVELSEITSDDSAVKKLGNHTAYAEILLDLSREAHNPPLSAAMAWRPTVLGRIHRLLDHYRPASPVSRRVRWAATVAIVPVIGLVTGGLAVVPPQSLVLDQLRVPFETATLSVARPFIPAEPFVPRTVAVAFLQPISDVAVTPSAPHEEAPKAQPTTQAVKVDFAAAPAVPQACVHNVRKAMLMVIIDEHTVLMKLRGEPYKRITVINDPNGAPDGDIKQPFDICVGDQVEPLGLERGLSFVAAIEDIDDAEAQALRDARNARLGPGHDKVPAVNFRGSATAGRTPKLCNDPRLTYLQINLCIETLNGTRAVESESLDDFKARVRATVKRRQAQMNRQSNTFGPTNLTGPINSGNENVNGPPGSGPPPPR